MHLMCYSGDAEFLAYPCCSQRFRCRKAFSTRFCTGVYRRRVDRGDFSLVAHTLLKGILEDIIGIMAFVSDQIIGPSIRRSASLQSAPVPCVTDGMPCAAKMAVLC